LNLERQAANLPLSALVVMGLVCMVGGLFIWLGGLGLKKVFSLIAGAAAGGICGRLLIGSTLLPIASSAVVGALIAVMLERAFMILLAAAVAGTISFFILACIYNLSIGNGLEETLQAMPVSSLAILGAVTAASVIGGIYFYNLTSAVSCAVLGTVLIFTGMVLLLIFKGAKPLSAISGKPVFYGAVFIAMVGFGSVEQLLLCRGERKRAKKKEVEVNRQEKQDTKHIDWRTQ